MVFRYELSASGNDFESKLIPEFTYNGCRYARFVISSVDFPVIANFQNPQTPRIACGGEACWFAVQPVTYQINNWDNLPNTINPYNTSSDVADTIELEAEECVISGIPFKPNWQTSLSRLF